MASLMAAGMRMPAFSDARNSRYRAIIGSWSTHATEETASTAQGGCGNILSIEPPENPMTLPIGVAVPGNDAAGTGRASKARKWADATLKLLPERTELIFDKFDSNAVNFVLPDGYFSIQTSVYLEDDPLLNEPFFEWNHQGSSQCGGLAKIVLTNEVLRLCFDPQTKFLNIYSEIDITPPGGVGRDLGKR